MGWLWAMTLPSAELNRPSAAPPDRSLTVVGVSLLQGGLQSSVGVTAKPPVSTTVVPLYRGVLVLHPDGALDGALDAAIASSLEMGELPTRSSNGEDGRDLASPSPDPPASSAAAPEEMSVPGAALRWTDTTDTLPAPSAAAAVPPNPRRVDAFAQT